MEERERSSLNSSFDSSIIVNFLLLFLLLSSPFLSLPPPSPKAVKQLDLCLLRLGKGTETFLSSSPPTQQQEKPSPFQRLHYFLKYTFVLFKFCKKHMLSFKGD